MESFDLFIIARPRALANCYFKRIRFVHALALFLTYKNRRKTGTLEKKKKDFWQRIREMRRQLSFSEYRGIDLTLFAVILCIAELLIVTAARFWYADQLYTVSAVAAVVAIVLMRWGPWAGIHAVLGGWCSALPLTGAPGSISSTAPAISSPCSRCCRCVFWEENGSGRTAS